MKEIAKLKTHLMEKDIAVAQFEIEIYDRFVMIDEYEILSQSHLPPIVEHIGMLNWLMSRCMSYTTHWQAYLFDAILQDGSRNKYAPFILSLNTNSASVSDWYWLQPEQNAQFEYHNQTIILSQTEWKNINWFNETNDICVFNSYLGKDVFVYDQYEKTIKAPVFAIDGESQNQFVLNNNTIWVKQRKSQKQVQNEVQCLTELKERGIIVPEIKTEFICVKEILAMNDQGIFDYDTRQNGMSFIVKKLLTSDEYKLVPLASLGQIVNALSMIQIVEKVEQLMRINAINKNAAKAIDDYVCKYSIRSIDGTNIGFIVDENGNAQLTVWSNIAPR